MVSDHMRYVKRSIVICQP